MLSGQIIGMGLVMVFERQQYARFAHAILTYQRYSSCFGRVMFKMREEIHKVKALSDKPFGVNLIPTAENDIWTPPMLEVIKQEKVPAVVYTGYGEGTIKPELFAELKQAGLKIIYRDLNPTPQNTHLAELAGADIIVATGFDEGGTLPVAA